MERVTLVMRGLTLRQARKIVQGQYGVVDWEQFNDSVQIADPEDDNDDNRCEIIFENKKVCDGVSIYYYIHLLLHLLSKWLFQQIHHLKRGPL